MSPPQPQPPQHGVQQPQHFGLPQALRKASKRSRRVGLQQQPQSQPQQPQHEPQALRKASKRSRRVGLQQQPQSQQPQVGAQEVQQPPHEGPQPAIQAEVNSKKAAFTICPP
jgi:hypothetical protein